MKTAFAKLVSIALMLAFLAAPCVLAAAESTPATSSSELWESVFLAVLDACEMTPDSAFVVTDFPERDPAFRFAHSLGIGDFMEMSYYDDGKGLFNSSILTIDISRTPVPQEEAYAAIFGAILACDLESTEEQWFELLKALCPMFDAVLSGEEQFNGAQVVELRGINYMMELNDDEKIVRFFTNVWTE